MTTNHIAAKIDSYLIPLIGELLAAATLKVQCEKIGTTVDKLTPMDLPQLAHRIEQALVVFLGLDRAKKIAYQIIQMPL
ncbi:MAG: hypothetical protein PHD29_00500 [bacterium]|nr:hypothetical protein [bacterium]MDD5756203.1 hypothetical protein [bacterium]